MMPRSIFMGAVVLLILSLGFFLFFLFLINPEYLNFSGFLLFYFIVFVLLWCFAFFVWSRMARKHRRSSLMMRNNMHHATLFSLLILAVVFLSHMRVLSLATFLPLFLFSIFIEYLIIRRN